LGLKYYSLKKKHLEVTATDESKPAEARCEFLELLPSSVNGARVGDLFMSLIHTCELNSVNPFDYMTELQKHANELSSHPEGRVPWKYLDKLQTAEAS
jgi:hypothetical protein